MNELLDYKQIDSLHVCFQKKMQAEILQRFTLHDDFKSQLMQVDFHKTDFSPDLFALYFTAMGKQASYLHTSDHTLFLDTQQDIQIEIMDPIASAADYFFAMDPQISASHLEFSVPLLGSQSVLDISIKLRRALALLAPIEASCVSSRLLNSVALFTGNQQIATSGTSLAAHGRMYIKEPDPAYPGFYYLDMIIHEISHLYCNMINFLYPLISDYTKTFFSAVRNTERPVFGIFNATFVLYRLLVVYRFAEALLRQDELAIRETDHYTDYVYARFYTIPFNFEFRQNIYLMKFEIGVNQLLGSDCITPAGRELLMAMKHDLDSNYL